MRLDGDGSGDEQSSGSWRIRDLPASSPETVYRDA
jgi:hypothetical protein